MRKRLPLHDLHVAARARFAERDGWEIPSDYGDAASEYKAARRQVGVIDRSHHGLVEVKGRDRAKFLHALLSNEIKALRPGQGCGATLLDTHGKVQVTLAVWVLEDAMLLITPPDMGGATVDSLDKFLFAEKVDLRDATGEASLFLLAGPGSADVAAEVTGARPAETAWSHAGGKLDGNDVRVVRGGGETGDAETWIMTPAAVGAALWGKLTSAGARPVGTTAFESLRIETGTPVFRHDVDENVLLPEIPFADLLSYSKGCYPGQEVVVRIRDRGHVNRMLRGLVFDGDVVPPAGAPVRGSEGEIGRVTSATWSYGLERPIALGFVRRQHAEPGTAVRVVPDGTAPIPATVSALPFTR